MEVKNKKMVTVSCKNCKRSFNKAPRDVKRFPNHFCSLDCYREFQYMYMDIVQRETFVNSLITKGVKRLSLNDLKMILGCGIVEPALTLCRKELWKRKLLEIKNHPYTTHTM